MIIRVNKIYPENYVAKLASGLEGRRLASTIKTANKKMYYDKKIEINEICETLSISRSSLYRWLKIKL